MNFLQKVAALPSSRRWWAAVASIVVVLLHELLGLDEEAARQIVQVVMVWIVGDSLHKTGFRRPEV